MQQLVKMGEMEPHAFLRVCASGLATTPVRVDEVLRKGRGSKSKEAEEKFKQPCACIKPEMSVDLREVCKGSVLL